jgi:hypothetical protein
MKATAMTTAPLAALALSLALAGCGGGGGVAPSGPAPANASGPPATMSMAISIPNPRTTSSTARAPRYVSDGTMNIAVYDGATLLYDGNLFVTPGPAFSTLYAKSGSTTVTPGDCVKGNLAMTCTLTVTTVPGPHTFGLTGYGELQGGVVLPGSAQRMVSDTGTPPTFTGIIVCEGELSMTAVGGNNPAQTITLLGVADIAQWFGVQTATTGNTVAIGYAIQDARSGQIVLPGNTYDNGPVTITADHPEILQMTAISQTTPPSTNGAQTFNVKCLTASNTIVTITASAGTHPNTAYASGLTYSSNNYSNGTLSQRGFKCTPGT